MKRKFIGISLILALFLFLSVNVSAQSQPDIDLDQDMPNDEERFYRTVVNFVIECRGDCPKNGDNFFNPIDTVGQRLEVCGERFKIKRQNNPTGDGKAYVMPKNLVINGKVGGNFFEASCPPGDIGPFKFYYWNGNEYELADSGGSMTLYPHDEKSYVSVLTEEEPIENSVPLIDKPPQLYRLGLVGKTNLTEDVPEDQAEPGDIVFMDLNPADNIIDSFNLQLLQGEWNPLGETISVDYQIKSMKTGVILEGRSTSNIEEFRASNYMVGSSFNDVLRKPYTTLEDRAEKPGWEYCKQGDDEPCNAALRNFDTTKCWQGDNVDVFSGASCGPNCVLGHTSKNYCQGEKPDSYDEKKLYTVTKSLIAGWRYPQISKEMCPSGFQAGEDCYEYSEVTKVGGPPTPEQLEKTKFTDPVTGLPIFKDPSWSEPYRFHVCGEDLDLLKGKTVYSPSENGKDLFRCMPNQGGWQPVTQCNDGVDNDGDGRIDSPDSWYQNNKVDPLPPDNDCKNGQIEYPDDCPSSVVGRLERDIDDDGTTEIEKVAFFDQSRQGEYVNQKEGSSGGCRYNSYQLDPGDITVDGVTITSLASKFKCDLSTGEIASHQTFSGNIPDLDKSDIEPGNMLDKHMLAIQEKCSEVRGREGYGDEMLGAIYEIPERYIPYGKQFASQDGYAPNVVQTVRDAENKYFNGAPPSVDQLKDKGVNETIAEPYTDTEDNDLSKTWTIGNRFAPNNDKIRGVTLLGDDGLPKLTPSEFLGGLAPKCPPNQHWGEYGAVWQCRSDQYHYILPDLSEDAAKNLEEVGVKIPTTTILKLAENTNNFDSIKGNCWRGGLEEKPYSESTSFDIDLPIDGETFPIYGFATASDDSLENYEAGDYSCNFTVLDSDGNTVLADQSRWANLWNSKSKMGSVSGTVASVADDYNMDYRTCSNVMNLPCDVFVNISTANNVFNESFFGQEDIIPAGERDEWRNTYRYLQTVSTEFGGEGTRSRCPSGQVFNNGRCVRQLEVVAVPLFYDDGDYSEFKQTAKQGIKDFADNSPLSELASNPMDRISAVYIKPSEVSDPDTKEVTQLTNMFNRSDETSGLESVAPDYSDLDPDKIIAVADIKYFAGDPGEDGFYTAGRASDIPGKASVQLKRAIDGGTIAHELGHLHGLLHTEGKDVSSCHFAPRFAGQEDWTDPPKLESLSNIDNWMNDWEEDGIGEIMNYCENSAYFSDRSDEYETIKYYMKNVISGGPVY